MAGAAYMFGCCVANRPVQTNMIEVDSENALFKLPNASSINHVCVFLLPTAQFPDNIGASVRLKLPRQDVYQLIGMLSKEKPSAIFRVRGTSSDPTTSPQNLFSQQQQQNGGDVDIGLSLEPIPSILAQLQSLPTSVSVPDTTGNSSLVKDPTLLAEKVVKNLFNYLSGFASGGLLSPEQSIPLGVVVKWYETFVGKVKAGGIGFLDKGD